MRKKLWYCEFSSEVDLHAGLKSSDPDGIASYSNSVYKSLAKELLPHTTQYSALNPTDWPEFYIERPTYMYFSASSQWLRTFSTFSLRYRRSP